MARLRPVTGYPGTRDWTVGVAHPDDDGVWRVDTRSGEKRLLLSFQRMATALRDAGKPIGNQPLFVNHSLWNREGDRIFFYARGGWNDRGGGRIDQPFVATADGSELVLIPHHFGGHPEWATGHVMIGSYDGRQVFYDTDRLAFVGTIGGADTFPRPGGDIALSPDGKWLVNGYRRGADNAYVVYNLDTGQHARSRRFDQNGWVHGDLRNDPAPCWNRDGTQILFPSIAPDAGRTRQMFLMTVRSN